MFVRVRSGVWLGFLFLAAGCGLSHGPRFVAPDDLPDAWRTLAERTNFVETDRYAGTVAFCRRLAAASPHVKFTSFGVTGQGRELPLLIVSRARAFTPAAARRTGKPLVLVQNCIHAGECEGKDASLQLVRDMLITGTQADLLDAANLLIIPIFNADGHERFGPFNRINQNGPREMGWRTTAANLNLNRDYTKADAIEMQAWLRLWNAWCPDVFIDNHTTDGHDHQYTLFYAATNMPDVAPPIAAWVDHELLPAVTQAVEAAGHATFPYSFPRDALDATKGVVVIGPLGPRLSTGFAAACNRVGILVETHALRAYGERVSATYEFLAATLRTIGRAPARLRAAIDEADALCIDAHGGDHDGEVPLHFELSKQAQRRLYKAVVQHLRPSEITGADVIEYTDEPADVETDVFQNWDILRAVTPPAAYLIPPEWRDVMARLELHGVKLRFLAHSRTLEVESCRFEDVKFGERPYEGRQMARYRSVRTHEQRSLCAGTALVPLNQPRAKLIVHLLEPEAPDSFVAWGFFNAIFERKEYFEAHSLEPIARRMLAEDAALREAFEERLKSDEAFAKDPGQRLEFFYRRSPYYDRAHNVYPVAWLTDAHAVAELLADTSVN